MDPWTIIGWAVIASAVVCFLVPCTAIATIFGRFYLRRLRSRKIQPRKGQVWEAITNGRVTVDTVRDDGLVIIEFWSGPCRISKPIPASMPGLVFVSEGSGR